MPTSKMQWLRTMILSDNGGIVSTDQWEALHRVYKEAIEKIVWPPGSDTFKIRPKAVVDGVVRRNGVKPIRDAFLSLMNEAGWKSEKGLDFGEAKEALNTDVVLYPQGSRYTEECTTGFGGFDFYTESSGLRVVIEWETGNISSSHRSINKLCICLKASIIDAGVLIVPSRSLYKHLTDRIGNIDELSGYLNLWQTAARTCERGLLAVTVVEHDTLAGPGDDVDYIPAGLDGNSLMRRAQSGSGRRDPQ